MSLYTKDFGLCVRQSAAWRRTRVCADGVSLSVRVRTCAQLLQVVAQSELDLGKLQGNAHGGHEPGGEAGVHAGAGGQGSGRHQLVTLELRARLAVWAEGHKEQELNSNLVCVLVYFNAILAPEAPEILIQCMFTETDLWTVIPTIQPNVWVSGCVALQWPKK